MIQRFLHRYGFGIQSPWAYSLVRNVLYEPLRYYAYDELREKFPQCSKTEQKRNEQLFRIVNHFKPQEVKIVGDPSSPNSHILASYKNYPDGSHPILYYIAPSAPISSISTTFSDGTVLVVDDIQGTNKAAWKLLTDQAQVTAIFDMQYRGLLYCDAKRIRQTYML